MNRQKKIVFFLVSLGLGRIEQVMINNLVKNQKDQ
jgi:ribosomal protein L30/L7E